MKRRDAQEVVAWWALSCSDLVVARSLMELAGQSHQVCFHCQQAAEKALKCLLEAERLPFRYNHDLVELLDRLAARRGEAVAFATDAAFLTEFAVGARYPSVGPGPTPEDAADALAAAARVVEWCDSALESLA